MELKKFYIVEAKHSNSGRITETKVFSTKKEAFECARQLARDSFDEIDVISNEGLLACANYDDLRTNGKLFKNTDC
jgi:hypothetical protein